MNIDYSKRFKDFFGKVEEDVELNMIVLHHIAAESVNEAIAMFEESKVSAHYLIDESGTIFSLVDENDIAYHAGISYWRGVNSLNKYSIGIEFLNPAPFEKPFSEAQLAAGIELCLHLSKKYNIAPRNIVGHSDVAYDFKTGLLDRKQDPSHLFDWRLLAVNGVGICPEIILPKEEDVIIFEFGNKDKFILEIKKNLQEYGFKVTNLNDEFDEEMRLLVRVFNRHFNQDLFIDEPDVWCMSSEIILAEMMEQIA